MKSGQGGPSGRIILADNLPVLRGMEGGSVQLIYVDPPFNTGRAQGRTRIRVERDKDGDRTGFQGARYRTTILGRSSYDDRHPDYLAFLEPRLREAHRVLAPTGSLFLHIDYREAHYCKIVLDEIFGRASFMNEIIWAYDYGARSKRKWPAKHDTIFWYAKDPGAYTFNYGEMDRIPYMAPGLVGREKAARGKTPTDVWWHTIVSPTGGEKTWAVRKGIDGIDEGAAEHLGEAVSQGVMIPASLLLFVIISRVHQMQMMHYRRRRSAGTLSSAESSAGKVRDGG